VCILFVFWHNFILILIMYKFFNFQNSANSVLRIRTFMLTKTNIYSV